MSTTVDRRDVLRFRFRRHQLDRPADATSDATDVDVLDMGVQDTGPDGAAWALHARGAPADDDRSLVLAWTLRGAPHAYRRKDIKAVAVATAPYSDADAAKRIYDASKPLREAGIDPLDALRVVADHMREIVSKPTVKGDLSGGLTEVLDDPYLRNCTPCQAIHAYEMPFRLAALQAGLELDAGTSPPVLRRIKGMRAPRYGHLADEADARFDVIRNHLRFYGPTRVADVATFLDAPQADVKAHWPEDVVEVTVEGAARTLLVADSEELGDGDRAGGPTVRLLGPYDPYLQLRDRELLVPQAERRKDLWRTLGRPGAIVVDGEVLGTWRPRTTGRRLSLTVDPWRRLRRGESALIDEQAARLAAHRGVTLSGVERT
ncbi:MAG: winged helix DNA-binding domain-containing protein [Ilumatobacteraceae bacterium]